MLSEQRIVQAILRNNFEFFVAKSFHTVSPGNQYLHNWHIDMIADKLLRIEKGEITRLIINIPPRYLKSVCINVAWPAWLLGKNPSKRIMTSSYSQALSNKHSQDCRVILNSKWYQELFPWTRIAKGENLKSKFVTTKRGFRFATSTGGTATGEGGDILIVDDPQNPNKINSKLYRENTIEWFEQTFISRLNNKKNGAIVIIMQRLHEDDLCGYLLKNKADQWDLLKIPAIYNQETSFKGSYEKIIQAGSVLHEQRENIDDLNKLKLELGEYYFAAQYNQNPSPSTGSMFKRKWLQYFSKSEGIIFDQIIQSWDTAIKIKTEHDYSVGITIGINNQGIYLLDVFRDKLEYPELLVAVKGLAIKWHPQFILIEDRASGQSLIQSLKNELFAKVIGIKDNKDKIMRIATYVLFFERREVFIDKDAKWRLDFEQELLSFPYGAHDDQIDALANAFQYLTKIRQIKRDVNLRTII